MGETWEKLGSKIKVRLICIIFFPYSLFCYIHLGGKEIKKRRKKENAENAEKKKQKNRTRICCPEAKQGERM
jgi:hypothetical protein